MEENNDYAHCWAWKKTMIMLIVEQEIKVTINGPVAGVLDYQLRD